MRASRRFFATACCSALALASAACSRAGGGLGPPAPAATTSASLLEPGPEAGAGTNPSAAAPAAARDPLLTGEVVKSKSIGHTSYVLKVTLNDGAIAVWKPRSRLPLGDRRYRGEIAAYRLAAALSLPNVPRQAPRSFAASSLRALQPGFDDKALPDDDGRVRGAIAPWLERYEVVPLERPAARAGWEPWLTDGRTAVPSEQRALARDLSNLLAFDYLTGNWDRFSGGNLARDGAAGALLYVDNDGAFYDPPPAASLAAQLALLRRVARFSKSFVAALRSLDESKLRAAFGDEAPGVPLLPGRVVAGVDQRRKTVLGLVDARLTGDSGVTFDFD